MMSMGDCRMDGSFGLSLDPYEGEEAKDKPALWVSTVLRLFTKSCICTIESMICIGSVALHQGVWRVGGGCI